MFSNNFSPLTLGVFSAGIIALIALGAYLYIQKGSVPSPSPADANPISASTTTPTTTLEGVSGTGDYTVEFTGANPPALRTTSITASLPEEAKTILRAKIEAQYEILRSEPTRVDIWLRLGVNRKIGGDFDGAIEAWNYVAEVAPNGMRATAYGNLGDLYMYFLKDYKKAETNFKKAIAINPNVIEYYRALFYLYRDINKDKAAVADILAQGLKANPNNPDLLQLQAEAASQ